MQQHPSLFTYRHASDISLTIDGTSNASMPYRELKKLSSSDPEQIQEKLEDLKEAIEKDLHRNRLILAYLPVLAKLQPVINDLNPTDIGSDSDGSIDTEAFYDGSDSDDTGDQFLESKQQQPTAEEVPPKDFEALFSEYKRLPSGEAEQKQPTQEETTKDLIKYTRRLLPKLVATAKDELSEPNFDISDAMPAFNTLLTINTLLMQSGNLYAAHFYESFFSVLLANIKLTKNDYKIQSNPVAATQELENSQIRISVHTKLSGYPRSTVDRSDCAQSLHIGENSAGESNSKGNIVETMDIRVNGNNSLSFSKMLTLERVPHVVAKSLTETLGDKNIKISLKNFFALDDQQFKGWLDEVTRAEQETAQAAKRSAKRSARVRKLPLIGLILICGGIGVFFGINTSAFSAVKALAMASSANLAVTIAAGTLMVGLMIWAICVACKPNTPTSRETSMAEFSKGKSGPCDPIVAASLSTQNVTQDPSMRSSQNPEGKEATPLSPQTIQQ